MQIYISTQHLQFTVMTTQLYNFLGYPPCLTFSKWPPCLQRKQLSAISGLIRGLNEVIQHEYLLFQYDWKKELFISTD